MAMATTSVFLLLCFLLCSSFAASSNKHHHEVDLRIVSVGPSKALPWEETLLELNSKDEARLHYLAAGAAAADAMKTEAPIASGLQLQSNNYVVRVSFGTPPQTLLLAVDISNDAAWVPCRGCVGCPSAAAPFDTRRSTTLGAVHCSEPQCNQVPNSLCTKNNTCSFTMTYGSSTFLAALSRDTLRVAGDTFPAYTFGCIRTATGNSIPPQGLLGLGRGANSLLSQTQSTYLSTFSYCLPTFRSFNFSGSLRLGPRGQPRLTKHTPLLTNPHRPSLYYVNMIGILVGGRRVRLPPGALDFNATTGAGTIIDSGTMFTRLVSPVYVAVRDEFRRQVGAKNVTSLGGFDTCYDGPVTVPTISFKFTGMVLVLPVENTVIHSTAGSITCLAMAAAPDNVNSVLNVIANMQQQNHRVLFDVPKSRLGVSRESCTTL